MRAEFCIFESNAPGLKANFYEPYVDKPTCDASGLGGFVRRYLSTRNLRITSNFFRCTIPCVTFCTLSLSCQTTLTKRQKKKKKKKDCQMSVYHNADPGELIQWVTHESRSSAASNLGLIRIGTPPRTADAWHHDSCRPRGVVTRDFSAILTVCLTVFPFEFRPRTFTIGFYGKKSFISELMILECSFPLRQGPLHEFLVIFDFSSHHSIEDVQRLRWWKEHKKFKGKAGQMYHWTWSLV